VRFGPDRPNRAEQEIGHHRPASDARTWYLSIVVVARGRLMKAISLWQPWASLWCSRRKVHETRHWRCSHRGWLLVHAAKRFEKDFELNHPLRLILDDEFGGHWTRDLSTGALIGMVNVVDCQPTQALIGDAAASDDDRECGDFAPGRFAWKRDEFRRFDQPIPYRGAQGFFNVPDRLIAVSGGCGRQPQYR
jgi:hypothetical protein